MTIRSVITDQMTLIAARNRMVLVPLSDDLALLESGLDSLCIAILVASLEDELGIDPFAGASEMSMPVTVGDLFALYENAPVSDRIAV